MGKITKAVIPVAGLGTRFLPATKAIPKELLPVVDKPALQYVVEEAFNSGLTEIILVTNPMKSLIEEHFSCSTLYDKALEEKGKHNIIDDLCSLNSKIKVISVLQKEAKGLGHAVLCAKEVVGDEDFIVILPDMIIDSDPPSTKSLIDAHDKTGKSVILVDHAPKEMISQYGIVGISKKPFKGEKRLSLIDKMVEKPKLEDAPSDLYIAGRYLLPSKIFSVLENVKPSRSGEIQLTDALDIIQKEDGMYALELNGTLHDTGDKLGYLKANVYYAMKYEGFRKELKKYIKTI